MTVVAFQGEMGANSHIAINEVYPSATPLPCPTFEDVFAAVGREGAFDMKAILRTPLLVVPSIPVLDLLLHHYDPMYSASIRRNFVQYGQATLCVLPDRSAASMVQAARELTALSG